jgi:hypothetical protein
MTRRLPLIALLCFCAGLLLYLFSQRAIFAGLKGWL